MAWDSDIWAWRFRDYSDDELRKWIRRVAPGDESYVDLIAIEELAKRVVAKDAAAGFVSGPFSRV